MSTKLYPEIDHIALGQRYCDHVLAMTAEGLHDKSDIAGQLAWRDQQLAAKDAEIAELRARVDSEESAFIRGQWAEQQRIANSIAADLRMWAGRKSGTPFEHSAFKVAKESEQIRDLAIERCKSATAERDEARECVGRLQLSAQAVLDRWNSPMWQWYNQGPTASLMNELRAALAATPEHLRGDVCVEVVE